MLTTATYVGSAFDAPHHFSATSLLEVVGQEEGEEGGGEVDAAGAAAGKGGESVSAAASAKRATKVRWVDLANGEAPRRVAGRLFVLRRPVEDRRGAAKDSASARAGPGGVSGGEKEHEDGADLPTHLAQDSGSSGVGEAMAAFGVSANVSHGRVVVIREQPAWLEHVRVL